MNDTDKRAIEEMAHDLCGRCQDGICVVDGKPCNLDLDCTCQINATTLYNAGYRKQSGWISVEERLPSSEDLERSQFHNFLVANEFGEVREAAFTGEYFAKLGSRLSGVTHWMPLPEPPVTKGA